MRHLAASGVLVRAAFGLAVGGLMIGATAGNARANITIIPTFDSTITSDPNSAAIQATINQAIQAYQTQISTPITVNLNFGEMSSGLGQSSSFVSSISYSQYLAALQAHAGSANDVVALATLPAGPNNPVNGTTTMTLTTAHLRALGFNVSPPAGSADSTIQFNTSIVNINRTSIDPSKFDLLAVIQHETDEALGLGSNLDSGNTTGSIRAMDLFRYSATGVRSFTTSSSATSYFSIDGGLTSLVGFNQVGPPGDSDYGDWVSSATPRVQDAFGTPGATPNLGVELTALDVIGYNPVPAPSAFGALALSGGLLARRRRAVISSSASRC